MSKNFKSTGSIWIGQKIEGCCIYAKGAFCQLPSTIFYLCFSLMKAVSLTTMFSGSEHTPKIFFHCCHSITANLGHCNLLKACTLPNTQTFLTFSGTEFKPNKKINYSFQANSFTPQKCQHKQQGMTFCTKTQSKEMWISQAKILLQQENLPCQISLTHHSKV